MTENKHAALSPSGAEGWLLCAARPAMESKEPDSSNIYADEGNAAHALASWCLIEKKDASAYLGRIIPIRENKFTVDDEMAEYVQVYLDHVREYAGEHEILVEQRLPIGHITGEQGAEGTGDAIIFVDNDEELQVHDLKYGRGVKVYAEHNPQLMLYALGALEKFDVLSNFKRVRMVIHQPRVQSAPLESDYTIEELQAFAEEIKPKAKTALIALEYVDNWLKIVPYTVEADEELGTPERIAYRYEVNDMSYFNPGETQCQFCDAKAHCPALAKYVTDTVGADFESLADPLTDPIATHAIVADELLGLKMAATDLIEDWCRAVRAKTESELLAGRAVLGGPGWKLVQGRKGNRAWDDEATAKETMKKMRLKEKDMYTFKLISPTIAEKLLKLQPKRWKKLTPLITRRDGKLSVAPMTDERLAVVVGKVEDDFDLVT